MSRTERYLPFILAIFIPLWGFINNHQLPYGLEYGYLLPRYLTTVFFLLLIWFVNRWALNTQHPLKAKIGQFGLSILSNGLIVLIIFVLTILFIPKEIEPELPIWIIIIRMGLVGLLFHTILKVFKTQKESAQLRVKNLELQADNLKFQLETLKQQINPHFLFNSLNTLLDLIEEDKQRAIKYTRNFSRLYRIVLQSVKHDFVQLKDELEFLDNYWSLLKTRFNDSIDLKIDIDQERLENLIPPLSLQFLVENAVKHNEASKQEPLVIEIKATDEYLVVENDLRPKSYPVDSEKVGLKNLQERFTALSKPITYGIKDDHFMVKLPLKLN